MADTPLITVRGLAMRHGEHLVLHDVSFTVRRGDVFVIMGSSGCGKSTLLQAMIGLVEPDTGEILYDGKSLTRALPEERSRISRRCGVMFQDGALWSGRTLAENVELPLRQHTELDEREIRELAELKLGLVGLDRFSEFYPDEISGSMRKRAGIARAMALDPEILFLDEPSTGLGPVGARHVDDLITQLRSSMNTTVIAVTHDLASIFATANDGIYLDVEQKTVTARGDPKELLAHPPNPRVRAFLSRTAMKEAS
jgi:phospholipid/cholesterol/gamma-HCH transport system ATP-binding protein